MRKKRLRMTRVEAKRRLHNRSNKTRIKNLRKDFFKTIKPLVDLISEFLPKNKQEKKQYAKEEKVIEFIRSRYQRIYAKKSILMTEGDIDLENKDTIEKILHDTQKICYSKVVKIESYLGKIHTKGVITKSVKTKQISGLFRKFQVLLSGVKKICLNS